MMAVANPERTLSWDREFFTFDGCQKNLQCGHQCRGIKDEEDCLPCLYNCDKNQPSPQSADDICTICFTESLASAPVIQMKCHHLFHFHCVKGILESRWSGPRISFGFTLCPICRKPFEHTKLSDVLQPIKELHIEVQRKAAIRLEYEGLKTHTEIISHGGKFYGDPVGFAMEKYAYYLCYKCNKSYYGGEARCNDLVEVNDDYDPSELVCGPCSNTARSRLCTKHGTEYLEYKCRYCCTIAVWYCFGTTHFCNSCHTNHGRVTGLSKDKLPKCPAGPVAVQLSGDQCPLNIEHPPTGDEFALGCGICENTKTF